MSVTEFDSGAVGGSPLPDPENWTQPVENINWPVKAVVVNVLATDDPNNLQGETLCDVQIIDGGYFLPRVAIYASSFHVDTDPDDDVLGRQNRAMRQRNIYNGESWTPEVGSICIVMFIGPPGPNREAAIMGFCPVSNQSLPHAERKESENIFPKEAQAVTVFDPLTGDLKDEYRSRMQPTQKESPRYTRMQNGAAFEIDNRGNINLQSSNNREPIEREVYDNYDYKSARIDKTPDPEGNIVLSTRGAKKGNIGLVTGKTESVRKTLPIFNAEGGVETEIVLTEELLEPNDEGNVLISTSGALQGRVKITTEETEDGVIVIIDKAGSTVTLAANGNIIISAASNAIVSAGGLALIGAAGATHPAMWGDVFLLWVLTNVMPHFHVGVQSGNSVSGPSSIIPPLCFSTKVLVA